MASGTVSALPLENCVQENANRLYTVNTYNVNEYINVIVPANCRAYVQFFKKDGIYQGGSGWLATGTHVIAEMQCAYGADIFKVTFSSVLGGNDATTPPQDGLKFTINPNPTETPETPVDPEEPEDTETGVKVSPTFSQGTIDNGKKGEIMPGVTTRVHSDYIYLSDIKSVKFGSDYKGGFHFYDENGTWMDGHIGGWQYGKKTGEELAALVSGATYVRIVVGRRTDAELYPENVAEDAAVITLVDGLNALRVPSISEAEPELPPLAEDPEVKINFNDFVYDRGNGLANTFAKLNKGEKINVLYMGGSVTNGTGATERELTSWRGIVGNWLAHNAGNGKVNNVNAAYGDTCTLFGAYRLNAEILPEEPDLIFVEFGINDMYNSGKRGYNLKDSAAQFETIIRNIRKALPECDIVTVLITEKATLNPNGLQSYAQAHENICIEYDIPSIHVGRALAKEIALSGTQWSDYANDSAHPNDLGYSVYAGPIKAYLASELAAKGTSTAVTNHQMPAMVSDELLDGDIQFIDADQALIDASEALGGTGYAYGSGATNLANSGTNVFKGGVFSKNENDVLAVKFTGTELAMIEYQPITGFSVSIDGGDYFTIKRDTVRPIVLATDLEYGEHIVRIKPIFSSQSSSFHIQGFFTRNQNAATTKGDCKHDSYIDGYCTGCGIYEVLEPTMVKEADGKWYYYQDGYKLLQTTLIKYSGKWFYLEDGEWDSKVTTLVKYEGKWFWVRNGKWDSSYTNKLVDYNGKKFYIKNGKWDSSTKGRIKIGSTYYLIKNGKLSKTTEIYKSGSTYYYFKSGKWSKTTGIVKIDGTQYYVKSGKWTKTTTLYKKSGKYYAIKSGKVTKSKVIIKYNGKKYYCYKGYAQTSFSGKVTISGKKYTVKKGIIK